MNVAPLVHPELDIEMTSDPDFGTYLVTPAILCEHILIFAYYEKIYWSPELKKFQTCTAPSKLKLKVRSGSYCLVA